MGVSVRVQITTRILHITYCTPFISPSSPFCLYTATELKRSKHPFLRGIYANGNEKVIGTKNLPMEDIHNYALDLRNQIGRKNSSNGYNKPVFSLRPSIQGEWHERMDLTSLDVQVTHKEL